MLIDEDGNVVKGGSMFERIEGKSTPTDKKFCLKVSPAELEHDRITNVDGAWNYLFGNTSRSTKTIGEVVLNSISAPIIMTFTFGLGLGLIIGKIVF